MSKPNNLLGQTFGRLVVIERAENDKFGKTRWLCRCECGNEKIINASSLKRGLTLSCGCNKQEKLKQYNLETITREEGNIYGYLTVISLNTNPEQQKDGRAMWNCKCRCGNEVVVAGKNLRNGHTTSCGCRRQSLGEEKIENLLFDAGINYSKEYLVDVREEKIYQHHKARYDFAIFKNNQLTYFIEYDGEQHFQNRQELKTFWKNSEPFEKRQERDELKNQWCRDNGVPLIRIPYTHYDKLNIEDLKLETTTFRVV